MEGKEALYTYVTIGMWQHILRYQFLLKITPRLYKRLSACSNCSHLYGTLNLHLVSALGHKVFSLNIETLVAKCVLGRLQNTVVFFQNPFIFTWKSGRQLLILSSLHLQLPLYQLHNIYPSLYSALISITKYHCTVSYP